MLDLTVVVPVYNVEKYLKRCVDSLINQTVQINRIILVDDGSTDSSGEICDDYSTKYENIQVIHQKNQGLSGARNSGIDLAETKYLGFVDSDDYVDSNMFEDLVKLLEDTESDISIGGVWIEKENGEKYNKYADASDRVMDTKTALIELNSYRMFDMAVWNKVFKRDLFNGIRFPIGKLCEDYYVTHRIIARADRVAYTINPFYHYIQRANSISRNKKINMAPIDASLAQMEFYQKSFPDIAYVAETACAFSHMGIYTAHIRNGVKCPKEILRECVKVSKKYLKSVLQNPYIPRIKKAQALAFCYFRPLYRYTVKRREHR